jgi:hypothetical protein
MEPKKSGRQSDTGKHVIIAALIALVGTIGSAFITANSTVIQAIFLGRKTNSSKIATKDTVVSKSAFFSYINENKTLKDSLKNRPGGTYSPDGKPSTPMHDITGKWLAYQGKERWQITTISLDLIRIELVEDNSRFFAGGGKFDRREQLINATVVRKDVGCTAVYRWELRILHGGRIQRTCYLMGEPTCRDSQAFSGFDHVERRDTLILNR